MLQVKKINEIPVPKTFLFYGKSGTGKTTLAGTFPKPLFLDINENVKDIDDTPPVINDISWSSTTSSIKLIVSADDEDGLIEKYYFKLNNRL